MDSKLGSVAFPSRVALELYGALKELEPNIGIDSSQFRKLKLNRIRNELMRRWAEL